MADDSNKHEDNELFAKHRMWIVHELERLSDDVKRVDAKIGDQGDRVYKKLEDIRVGFDAKMAELNTDLVMLKTKAAIWGAGVAMVTSAIVAAVVGLIVALLNGGA